MRRNTHLHTGNTQIIKVGANTCASAIANLIGSGKPDGNGGLN